MLGDITPLILTSGSAAASRTHQVASGGTPPAINAGEPVGKTVGSQYVIIAANAMVDVTSTTAKLAGISTTTSTETATAAGTVSVTPVDAPNAIWLISPQTAATWGQTSGAQNQTTYNALVGARVLLQSTSGTWTILASDSVNNACVIENLDITKYPGKVAFSLRAGTSYLA
jgi:hypothetical protein